MRTPEDERKSGQNGKWNKIAREPDNQISNGEKIGSGAHYGWEQPDIKQNTFQRAQDQENERANEWA